MVVSSFFVRSRDVPADQLFYTKIVLTIKIVNLQEARVCETHFENCIIAKSHKIWLVCRVVIVYELFLMSAPSDLTELNIQLLVALVVKNPPASADTRDTGSIPGSGRSPGGRHGNPL